MKLLFNQRAMEMK